MSGYKVGRKLIPVLGLFLLLNFVGMVGCERSEVNFTNGNGESVEEEQGQEGQTQEDKGEEEKQREGETKVVDLRLSPNPVEPNSALTVKVLVEGQPSSVSVTLRGAGGSAEPVEYWRKTPTLTLKPGGPGEWVVGTVAPGQGGVYPVNVKVGESTVSKPEWLVKVYPRGFLALRGSTSAAEAVKFCFERDFKGCELREIKERPLLEDDKRDPRFHKLFMVVFFKPFEGSVLPSGEISYFYYVVKDGPDGLWRVMQGGTGP